MSQKIARLSLVVSDYDEAIHFYTEMLGFELLEDTPLPDEGKRWVVVAPTGGGGASLLLALAADDHQKAAIGDQTGGRVFLFLTTDDFWRDYHAMTGKGVRFHEQPREEPYGTVAVFEDLYGNLWDLLESRDA